MDLFTDPSWRSALAGVGITGATLTTDEKRALDERGYLLLPRAIEPAPLEQMRVVFEAAFEAAHTSGAPVRGTRHISNAALLDELFAGIYTHPKLLAAAAHVLRRPFRLVGVGGRDPLPGHGAQALHADWGPREAGDPYFHVNSIWLLDDFTRENGATRLVPGTHFHVGKVPRSLSDPADRHADEVEIVAPAGSALIFNAHLLHSGTRNRSQGTRRTLTCSFVARDAPHYGSMEGAGHPLAEARWLEPDLRLLLGVGVDQP
jgi:hypothetical protein